MGDILNSLPVAAALQAAHPDATIDSVIEERWQELLCAPGISVDAPRSRRSRSVNNIYTVNTRAWRDSPFSAQTRSQIFALRKAIRESGYTAVIDVQGAIRSAVIAKFSCAPRICGLKSLASRRRSISTTTALRLKARTSSSKM